MSDNASSTTTGGTLVFTATVAGPGGTPAGSVALQRLLTARPPTSPTGVATCSITGARPRAPTARRPPSATPTATTASTALGRPGLPGRGLLGHRRERQRGQHDHRRHLGLHRHGQRSRRHPRRQRGVERLLTARAPTSPLGSPPARSPAHLPRALTARRPASPTPTATTASTGSDGPVSPAAASSATAVSDNAASTTTGGTLVFTATVSGPGGTPAGSVALSGS